MRSLLCPVSQRIWVVVPAVLYLLHAASPCTAADWGKIRVADAADRLGRRQFAEDLRPAARTAAGGIKGGALPGAPIHGSSLGKQFAISFAAPAPPHQFPATCRWQSPKKIAFIHVGKCAGSSLDAVLSNYAPFNYTHVHTEWSRHFFNPEDFDLFVITTRDPVDRFVSSFNYAHPIGGDQTFRHYFETAASTELFDCFPELPGAVNRFAEALDEDSACGLAARRCMWSADASCGQFTQNFPYYLQTGLQRASLDVLSVLKKFPEKHALMVPAENFSAGVAALWEWLCAPPALRPSESVHKNIEYARRGDKYLSSKGRDALTRYTLPDAFALEELGMLIDK